RRRVLGHVRFSAGRSRPCEEQRDGERAAGLPGSAFNLGPEQTGGVPREPRDVDQLLVEDLERRNGLSESPRPLLHTVKTRQLVILPREKLVGALGAQCPGEHRSGCSAIITVLLDQPT